MKRGKARSVVLLAALWILIGGVWFAGLNWPRWIASDTASDPVRTTAEDAPAEPVIYTLTADPDERTNPADLPVEADRSEPPVSPEPEPASAPEPDLREEDPVSVEPDPAPDQAPDEPPAETEESTAVYVLNTHTKKIHLPDCKSVKDMKESNKALCEDPEEALAEGYAWCKRCHG